MQIIKSKVNSSSGGIYRAVQVYTLPFPLQFIQFKIDMFAL